MQLESQTAIDMLPLPYKNLIIEDIFCFPIENFLAEYPEHKGMRVVDLALHSQIPVEVVIAKLEKSIHLVQGIYKIPENHLPNIVYIYGPKVEFATPIEHVACCIWDWPTWLEHAMKHENDDFHPSYILRYETAQRSLLAAFHLRWLGLNFVYADRG